VTFTYFLIAPRGAEVPWPITKAVGLRSLADPSMVLHYCEGPEPPTGATGCLLGGEKGEIIWWPDYQAPSATARGLLIEQRPEKGKEPT